MDEFEELRQRRQQALQEQAELQQQLEQLEGLVKNNMSKDALARYGNLKVAHPERAVQLLIVLAQAIQAKQIGKVDDETLKRILEKITPQKRDITIRRV
ncbi:hypothetical protein J4457_06225 [Candidatus Woesearchaeota archaeon]|nr:hypothetical protein [Candidatus Woesearchaeota archaeon]